jgi:D-alanine-D-alanine ligase
MAKQRIAVLYDIWYDDKDEEEEPKPSPSKRRRKPAKEDHQEIHEALRESGHSPFYVTVDGTRESLIELAKVECDLFFNLTGSWAGDDTKDIHLAAYLELCGFKYTGTGPFGIHLSQNKALAKKIFAFHGIRTPFFAMVYRGRLDWAHDDLSFPVIVKPAREDGSIGIEFNAVCESIKELMERIHDIHEKFDSPALIEEYIDGREFYVAVLGNDSPQALPVVELDLSKLPEGTPKIAGTEVKWRTGTEAYRKTKSIIPTDLDEKTVKALHETAIAAYQALEMKDYGRIDMRQAKGGKIYVLEVNPNPWLHSKAEMALAAKESGRSYAGLIDEIVNLALSRYPS